MRPIHAVLASVLLVGGLIVLFVLSPEPPGLGGTAHDVHRAMRAGGETPTWTGTPLLLGWAFGAAVIAVLGSLVWFGGVRGEGRRGLRRLLLLVVVLHLAAWSWMIVEAHRYELGETNARWLGLPRPTAVFLFAFGPMSLAYSGLFVGGFRRWVLTEEERRRFRDLVASREDRGS